ncbi:hypothetical protein JB92DRAFT_2847626 [Gautieria morchelliformis]|nr:hypothetical protein JB92DRAFT_2847626 [Gautieria morchelliformis]
MLRENLGFKPQLIVTMRDWSYSAGRNVEVSRTWRLPGSERNRLPDKFDPQD